MNTAVLCIKKRKKKKEKKANRAKKTNPNLDWINVGISWAAVNTQEFDQLESKSND